MRGVNCWDLALREPMGFRRYAPASLTRRGAMDYYCKQLIINILQNAKKFTHILLTFFIRAKLICEIIGSIEALRIITGN